MKRNTHKKANGTATKYIKQFKCKNRLRDKTKIYIFKITSVVQNRQTF